MLKWFAAYNKYLLATIMVLLMIAFLIQPTMSMLMPSGDARPEGESRHGEIVSRDLRLASSELRVLQMLNPQLAPGFAALVGQPGDEEAVLRWVLVKQEAEALGLSTSDLEVDMALAQIGLGGEEGVKRLDEIAERVRARPETIRATVASWLVFERYRDLSSGNAKFIADSFGGEAGTLMPAARRLWFVMQAQAVLAQMGSRAIPVANRLVMLSQGAPRLGEPELAHQISEQSSTVMGTLLPVPATRYLDEVGEASEERLIELFETYKSVLPGRGELDGKPAPRGLRLGYRYADRVKMAWLELPLEAAMEAVRPEVEVDVAAAQAYYDEHADRLNVVDPDDPTGQTTKVSFEDAFGAIVEVLVRERAAGLVEEAMRDVQSAFREQTRGIERELGYFVLPEGYEPPPLERVADRVEQKYGFRPIVRRTDDWLGLPDLPSLPGIGQARVASSLEDGLVTYVNSAKELGADDRTRLVNLWLQAGVGSKAMVDGSLRFKLWGTERIDSPFVATASERYGPTGTPRGYRVPLGNYLRGRADYLVFINDQGADRMDPAESVFSEVRLVEPSTNESVSIDFSTARRVEYGEKLYLGGSATPESLGRAIRLKGAVAIAVPVDYEITPETQLVFTFTGRSEGTEHSIGVDHDLLPNSGSQYAFRLTAAQDSHPPASLDEVRDAVVADARLLAAMDEAAAELPMLIEMARERGLGPLATELGLRTVAVEPTPKREAGPRGGLVPPGLPALGRSGAVIDAMFDKAKSLTRGGVIPMSVGDAQRTDGVVLDTAPGVALYRVEGYQPVSEMFVRTMISSPEAAATVAAMLPYQTRSGVELDALIARTGYVPASGGAGSNRDEDRGVEGDTGSGQTEIGAEIGTGDGADAGEGAA